MKLRKATREALVDHCGGLVELGEQFDVENLGDFFAEDPVDLTDPDDDDLSDINFIVGYITGAAEVLGKKPTDLLDEILETEDT